MLVLKIAGGIILAVILLTVGCSVLVTSSTDEIDQQLSVAQESIQAQAEADIAAEEAAAAEAVTWEWVADAKCDYSRCSQIRVTSDRDCPNGIYAEANLLNAADEVVDYTNDSLGRLDAGTTAIMTFAILNDDVTHAEVAKVTCN
jgi:hypothetical protein